MVVVDVVVVVASVVVMVVEVELVVVLNGLRKFNLGLGVVQKSNDSCTVV